VNEPSVFSRNKLPSARSKAASWNFIVVIRDLLLFVLREVMREVKCMRDLIIDTQSDLWSVVVSCSELTFDVVVELSVRWVI